VQSLGEGKKRLELFGTPDHIPTDMDVMGIGWYWSA
jgi:hypothetical protein